MTHVHNQKYFSSLWALSSEYTVISFRLAVVCGPLSCVPFISTLKHFSRKREKFFLIPGKHGVLNNLYLKLCSQHCFQVCLSWDWNWAVVCSEQVMQEHPLDKAKSDIISSSSFLQVIFCRFIVLLWIGLFHRIVLFFLRTELECVYVCWGAGGRREKVLCYSCSLHTETW